VVVKKVLSLLDPLKLETHTLIFCARAPSRDPGSFVPRLFQHDVLAPPSNVVQPTFYHATLERSIGKDTRLSLIHTILADLRDANCYGAPFENHVD